MGNPGQNRVEERVVTVFFSDVSNFSWLSMNLPPANLFLLYNQCLTEMSKIIEQYGGTIDKFLGDAIVAIFGAPILSEDHAQRAVLSAIDMQQKLVELRKGWQKREEIAELERKWVAQGRGQFVLYTFSGLGIAG